MDVSHIDEFDVGQVLGRGGFGMVHRARHRATGRDVALKIIDKQQMRASGMTERVVNEVTLHSALRHPSIVELLGYFEDNHCVYLVMELCCRGDLYRYLRRQPGGCLQEDEAARLLVQVLSALAYLHHQHIVHRDLKLSNLLLTRDLRVKLSDFGLAVRLQSPDEEHFTLCGTPNYIAPEMATQGPHGLPADLWSIGCLFYTLVAGKAPFQGEATSETLAKASRGRYALPERLSPLATDFLQSLLQTDPCHRLSISSVLSHPFICQHAADAPPPCSPISIPSPTGIMAAHHQHQQQKPLPWKQQQASPSSTCSPTLAPSSSSSSSSLRSRHHDSLATIAPSVPLMEPLSQHTTADGVTPPSTRPAAAASAAPCPGLKEEPSRPSPPPACSSDDGSEAPAAGRPTPSQQHQPAAPPATPPIRPPPYSSPPPSPPRPSAELPPAAAPPVCCASQEAPVGGPRVTPMGPSTSPSAWRRKRGLPSTHTGPAAGHGAAAAPPAPSSSSSLLTPISTRGLAPFHFALPGGSSLRLHRDGHLTLRLPHGSMRVYRQGLRVDVCGSSSPHPITQASSSSRSEQQQAMTLMQTFTLLELPGCWRPAYCYAARLVDHIRSRVPKITLFVLQEARQHLRGPAGGRRGGGAAVAKCMLMENGPLPDFLMRWVDGAQLSYQLRDGKLQLRLRDQQQHGLTEARGSSTAAAGAGGGSVCYRWRLSGGGLDGWPCSTSTSSLCGSEGVSRYLAMAQHAMMRCLELEPSVQDGSRRGEQPAGMAAPAVGDAAEGSSSCCWSSSALVLYEYLEPLAADPLTGVLGLTVGQGVGQGRPVAQQAEARQGGGSDQEEEEEHGHEAPARATSTVRGASTSAAQQERPMASRPAVSSVQQQQQPRQQQQQQPRQQQASQPPPAAVLQKGASIGGGERNRVTVLAGVGRGWRDEASGALVVQFEDGALVRLDQDAQVLTYRARQGEEEEQQSFVLPGSSRQGQRVKIPREVRDRMKHLGDFIRAMQHRPTTHGNR